MLRRKKESNIYIKNMSMEIKDLNKEYDKLQMECGAKELDSIYNGGLEKNPDICFVFMNPTGRNIASSKEWKGRKSPWIGTKNILDLFYSVGLQDEKIYRKIKSIKAEEWTEEFADEVYEREYNVYSVYYPIGNGRFNIDKSIEDIKWIIDNV